MKGNDADPRAGPKPRRSVRPQGPRQSIEQRLEGCKLVIDRDPKRLKGAGRGMLARGAGSGAVGFADKIRKESCRVDRPLQAFQCNFSRNPISIGVLAISANDVSELLLWQ